MRRILFLCILIHFSLLNLAQSSLYSISINDIDGNPINLTDFNGKKILFVNVASKCGFTSQYADLERLHQLYKTNLVIIGVPCNQFGNQEPGTLQEIKSFCTSQYNISFLLTEKIDVKGKSQHSLYEWLTKKENNGKINSSVKWNFQKYLVDETGILINYFYSTTNPRSSKIISLIKQ